MIAHQAGRTVFFLAARVKSRLRLAAPIGSKAMQVLAHRAFRLGGQEQTVSDGSCQITARIALVLALLIPPISLGVCRGHRRV